MHSYDLLCSLVSTIITGGYNRIPPIKCLIFNSTYYLKVSIKKKTIHEIDFFSCEGAALKAGCAGYSCASITARARNRILHTRCIIYCSHMAHTLFFVTHVSIFTASGPSESSLNGAIFWYGINVCSYLFIYLYIFFISSFFPNNSAYLRHVFTELYLILSPLFE